MDLIPRKVDLYVNKEILGSHYSFRGPSPCSRPALWGSPTRNSTGLNGDAGHLNWTPPPRLGLHRYIVNEPRVISPAVKVALQNPSRLLISRNGLIIRRIIPVRHSVNGGLSPSLLGTSPPSMNGIRDKNLIFLFFGLSHPVLAKNNVGKWFFNFFIFFLDIFSPGSSMNGIRV